MDHPQNSVWGPALWSILHYTSAQIGTKEYKKLPNEESRIWLGLLSSLRYSLPCPLCKRHYLQFFGSHPIMAFTKESIFTWLFNLHSKVNESTKKDNTLSIENAMEMYSYPAHFSSQFIIFARHLLYAVRLGWVARQDMQRTLRFLEELKCYYDLQ